MNIKNKRTVFILLTFLKSNLNSILLKKKADWVAYVSQKNSVWLCKCKTITGLEAREKNPKAWVFCSFLLLFFNSQIANVFIIQTLSIILFHIGIITPSTDSPSETPAAAPWHGGESQGATSRPRAAGRTDHATGVKQNEHCCWRCTKGNIIELIPLNSSSARLVS